MAGGAPQVEQAPFREHDDAVAVGELVAVALGLDVDVLDAGVGFEAGHVDFVIEVPDVANNRVVLHLGHVFDHDDVLVTGGGDEDIGGADAILDGGDLEPVHGGLQGADGVDFGDDDARASRFHGLRGALAHVTEASDEHGLGRDHHVGGAHDPVGEGMAAAVQVVELALGDGVVDVDCGEQEFAGFLHFVQPFHAGGGFLGNPDAGANGALPPLGVLHQVLRDRLQHQLHLRVVRGGRVGNRAALLELELGLVTLCELEKLFLLGGIC